MSRHYVHFTREAIVQILLNGFEAFVIKHHNKKRHAIEMHASLYGHTKPTSSTIHHHISFISVDTSAKMEAGQVTRKGDATSLKQKISQAAGYSLLGAIHSHPYLSSEMSLSDVRQAGSRFSPGDLDSFKEDFEESTFFGSPHSIQSILTIRNKNDGIEHQKTEKDGFLEKNVFEFSLANCKCFLMAQAFSINARGFLKEEDTILKCEFLQNFEYLCQDFGKVGIADGRQRIVEHRP